MANQQSRKPFKPKGPGPYVAKVVGHLDSDFMGTLEVAIIKGYADDPEDVYKQTVPAHYLSPFYGVTNLDFSKGVNKTDYDSTQKSYGMWMVPPDIGTRVLIIFVGGNYNDCYWIGCVPDKYMNYMIPGVAAMDLPASTPGISQFGSYTLPVAEYNKKSYTDLADNDPPRPIHTYFANTLLQQGLLSDTLRGTTTSSARREAPSMVFGISTPGPLDKASPSGLLKYGQFSSSVPSSRLGGSTFVMDDGDLDGENELVRIRTRTGHQILMHNTADLIYIINSQGTAWIELTSNGKIDIYANDSVSIHSEQDFNFRADRNVNIEAGQNVNISANAINLEAKLGDFNLSVGGTSKISSQGQLYINSLGNIDVFSNSELKILGAKGLDLYGMPVKITGSEVSVMASKIKNTAGQIYNNSPAGQADKATPADYQKPDALPVFGVPTTGGSGSINSILQRVPTAEPWPQHESTDPAKYSPLNTDNTPAAAGTNTIPGSAPANTTAPGEVDPAGAIIFSTGSGNAAHFAKTTSEFQQAFISLAVDYKGIYGKPVKVASSFRSYSEQLELYNLWYENGGKNGQTTVNIPGRGRITTPVKPDKNNPNTHGRGIAADIDQTQASVMYQKGLLKKYGFSWGGLFSRPDPVHIYLSSPNATSTE
jgi:mannose-6-phosphate isomerase-like protein (cupin superfamily)